jgi:AbrB family looped-hinge helix DNA binding protein
MHHDEGLSKEFHPAVMPLFFIPVDTNASVRNLTVSVNVIVYKYMNIQLAHKKDIVMPTVKVGASGQIVIPKKLYDELKLAPGDYIEVERHGNKLVLTPKELVEKHPEIDRRLAEAEEDVKVGRLSGPFQSADELARHLESVNE